MRTIVKTVLAVLLAATLMFPAGCADAPAGGGTDPGYRQISQDEAREMMARDDGHVVVDVRRQDEYDAGHIPGAVLIPNESIGTERPEELPDPDQIILIYCRSGNRSKQAAKKLSGMGYTNLYEFGGITDWTGEIVTGEDGTPDTEGRSGSDAAEAAPALVIEANGRAFRAVLEDNTSAGALAEKLRDGAVELELHDYGGFEKVGPLPWSLPRNDVRITTVPGDVILYQGSQITIYYDENTWEFTRLARIPGATKEELLEAFGGGNVTVSLRLSGTDGE